MSEVTGAPPDDLTDDEGAEPEDTRQERIDNPFNPNQIRIRQQSFAVYSLVERLKAGELDLEPDFQRMPGIWDDKNQSRLIESLLIKIPLPAFYLDEIGNDRFAVVDGIQRLTALQRFITKQDLALQELEFLSHLNGSRWNDLDTGLKRRVLEAQIIAYVIEPGTPDAAKLNIFKRLNTGGLTLTLQEIRHAMNPGPVRKLLKELAHSLEFKQATQYRIVPDRMDDREMVTRFFAFREGGVVRYRQSKGNAFDGFLNAAMKNINEAVDKGGAAVERDLKDRFLRAMRAARDTLGGYAFRREKNGRRTRVNKAIFEALSVALDERSDADLARLRQQAQQFTSTYLAVLGRPDVEIAVIASTGDPSRVEKRFASMREVIEQVLT